ncbi:ROK family protein [Paenibacillus abyssi]|uniref:Transcriptional regulator n=2 Tax=Paenibacillus abyssi TaxID=1340531 RepID=A0A917G0B5_9BACL|nr:ROK family protein [Paenibacillus abyssi]GGG16091.1 transcriptional regulator [Paenibacillus abyssi]
MKSSIPTAKKRLFERIAHYGTVSKAELQSEVSMKSSSLTRLLDDLTASGIITESGLGESTGGRRPILYSCNSDYGYLFGLDISRVTSTLGLFDLTMKPLSLIRWRMDEHMTPEHFTRQVEAGARQMLIDHGVQPDKLIGIGIGAVGPLDPERGMILEPLFFPAEGWSHIAICKELEQRLAIPAYLENGANTALIGEHWAVRLRNVHHMLYVHAGVGLRSSMMSDGRIVRGSIDQEGSIGQMIIQSDGPRLQEGGNYGALEAFVSLQAVVNQVRSDIKRGRESILSAYRNRPDDIDFDRIVEAARQGDALAREQFVQTATYFGIGLANLINILHPEEVILGGPLVGAHDAFYDTAITIARQNTYYYPDYQPRFSKGILKEDAVATGAAVMVMKQMAL